jgi:hypothetical protein
MNTKLYIPQQQNSDDYFQTLSFLNVVSNLRILLRGHIEIKTLDLIAIESINKNAPSDETQSIEAVFLLDEFTTGITALPKLYIFSWPYPNLPTRKDSTATSYIHFSQNDIGVICLSSSARDLIKREFSTSFPIYTIPWLSSEASIQLKTTELDPVNHHPRLLTNVHNSLDGLVIDDADFNPCHETHKLGKYGDLHPIHGIVKIPWNGSEFSIPCNTQGFGPQYMSGFYASEPWGTWTKSAKPTINLPYIIQGKVILTFKAVGFGRNINRDIKVSIGSQHATFQLQLEQSEHSFEFDIREPQDTLTFSGLDLNSVDGINDDRTLGIGLTTLTIRSTNQLEPESKSKKSEGTFINGVVYTAIIDPAAPHSNFRDLLSAFCAALGEHQDANLIILAPPQSTLEQLSLMTRLISSHQPIKCRIIICQGEVDTHNLNYLYQVSSYYLSACQHESSSGLSLSFASRGIPTVAPFHSALRDSMCASSSLIVKSSREPMHKSLNNDEQLHSFQYRINWESLRDQIKQAHRISTEKPEEFFTLSTESHQRLMEMLNSDEKNNFVSSIKEYDQIHTTRTLNPSQ